MPKKPKVRCVKNVRLEVVRENDQTENKLFSYGKYYLANLIQEIQGDEEYWNIFFEDGSRVEYVSRHIFENFGVRMEVFVPPITQENEREEKIDLVFSNLPNVTPTEVEEVKREENVENPERERQEEGSSEV